MEPMRNRVQSFAKSRCVVLVTDSATAENFESMDAVADDMLAIAQVDCGDGCAAKVDSSHTTVRRSKLTRNIIGVVCPNAMDDSCPLGLSGNLPSLNDLT
jgi:hypothetical protein